MITPGPKSPGDDIKHCVAIVMSGLQPSKAEQNAALSEGVELAFGLLADVKRIAGALETIATVADSCSSGGYHDVRTTEA